MMSSDLGGSANTGPSQVAYTIPGTYSWVCPYGVTSISVVCVGGGAPPTYVFVGAYYTFPGGGGGALAYVNNISVIPGNSYTVIVGNATGLSSFDTSPVAGGGSSPTTDFGGAGGSVISGIGGSGGSGGMVNTGVDGGTGGCGGAGGYGGAGGGGAANFGGGPGAGASGSGGGGGGGGNTFDGYGGGVGLLGQGADGAGGFFGQGGSGGGNATSYVSGLYGGGGNGTGAVRIIWPGTTRQFPSTNTGDM